MGLTEKICRIVARELEIDESLVTTESNSDNTENWDSLGQLRIILATEDAFRIQFLTDEIQEIKSVEKLRERIQALRA